MNIKRFLSVFVAITLFVITFSSCGSEGNDEIIYLNIKNTPTSLDAQTAETDEELLIVRNIYEGLFRKDENGDVVLGACDTYRKDGNTYTFNIRNDAVWSDNTPLTAYDFVFGFRRAVNKTVDSPFAKRLFAIKNAKEIYENGADVSTLGVTATNDKTLVITLTSEDADFEETLTTSVCMPCNEAFFEKSEGKYGLEADCVLSNGSYMLSKWNQGDFGIRLRKNEKYSGNFTAKNGAVFISSVDDEESTATRFEKNSFDIAFVGNDELGEVLETGVSLKSVQNICWVMTIGNEFAPNVRQALLSAFSADIYKDKLGEGFTVAHSLYPDILNAQSDVIGKGIRAYDIEWAKSVFSNAVSKMTDKQFPNATLYYGGNQTVLPAIRAILGHWQKNLCAFVNVTEAKHPDELVNELSSHSLQFAVFPVSARSGDTAEYLEQYGISAYSNEAVIQEQLLNGSNLVPIAFENTNICYTDKIKSFYLESYNGYIDFSFAIKEK